MMIFRGVLAATLVASVSACSLTDWADNLACATAIYSDSGDNCDDYQAMADCYSGSCYDECMEDVQNYLELDIAVDELLNFLTADYVSDLESCTFTCSSGCFPATATVALPNGESKSMDQLTIGDKIHAGADKYSEVYYFSTEVVEITSRFVELSTKKASLQLTPGHYLYVNGKLAQASTVQVGDELTLADGSKSAVVAVGSKWGPGLYNPHTMTGDVVVDGVLTSTYTDAVHPKLAHALLFPLRKMYEAGLTFGTGFNDLTKGLPQWIHEIIAV